MESISVSVRVRPLSRSEAADGAGPAWRIDGNTIAPRDAVAGSARYALDHVFGPEWNTRQVYDATAHSLIKKVVAGFNGTVFAYGQTSSGKTFSMRGTESEPGLIPLAVREVFDEIMQSEDREFLLRVSYMEAARFLETTPYLLTSPVADTFSTYASQIHWQLYNEEVNDLLAPANVKLPIHENKDSGVYVVGLREDIVTTAEQVLGLLDEGEANRHTGATKMNDQSSRSHTVFRMVVESRGRDQVVQADGAGAILVSTLTLVDLAGSERVAKTGAEGIRMKEGTAINKSLLTLGNVINKLSEGVAGQAGGHIPYRDSKLTRILQPSLGGNAKTAIICAMTPAGCHVEESHSTLRFACRAKRVINNAVVNEVLSDAAVLKRQAREIEELRKILASSGGNADVENQIGQLRAQLLHSEQEKELMRITLREEKGEREKAQKQAEVAKMLMLERQQRDPDAHRGRNSRRETWCPGGKAAWEAPPPSADGSSRKRPLLSSGSGMMASGSGAESTEKGTGEVSSAGRSRRDHRRGVPTIPLELPFLEEAEEEEEGEGEEEDVGGAEDVREGRISGDGSGGHHSSSEDEALDKHANGPTPQRQRREKRGTVSAELAESLELVQAVMPDLLPDLQQSLEVLPAAECGTLEALLLRWRQLEVSRQRMQVDIDRALTTAEHSQAELSVAQGKLQALEQDKAAAIPEMEKLRWQCRQHERGLEELRTAQRKAAQEHQVTRQELHAKLVAAADLETTLRGSVEDLSQQSISFKEQIKGLNGDVAHLKGQSEIQEAEKAMLLAREEKYAESMAKAEAKLKEKADDLDTAKRALEAAEQQQKEAETRSREVYECNKRLESHVQDLESRKRAPLYQKRQEEELQAALAKAAQAEIRAHEAELRMRELKVECEAAERRAAEQADVCEKVAAHSAEHLSQVTERHKLEVQRLDLERATMQASHQEVLQELQASLQTSQAHVSNLQAGCQSRDEQLRTLTERIEELKSDASKMAAAHAELQACADAAVQQVAHLEDQLTAAGAAAEAAAGAAAAVTEEAAARHRQQLASAAAAQEEAIATASEAHNQARAALLSELTAARASGAAVVAQLEQQLQEAAEKTSMLLQASTEDSAQAAKVKQELQDKVDQLTARVAEAAGALKAKDELRDERQRHKQEVGALRAELQKLQAESKSGTKGKDMAQKELEATKKRLQDAEAKLKVATQDKTVAIAARAELDRQLRQKSSQQMLLEKSLEKSATIESKKRESIMVDLSRRREQLAGTEERVRELTVEVQKAQMDLLAKTGECNSLQERLEESEISGAKLQEEVEALQQKLEDVLAEVVVLTSERDALSGTTEAQQQLGESLTQQLTELQQAHQARGEQLSALTEEEKAASAAAIKHLTELLQLQQTHAELSAQHQALMAEHADMQAGLQCAKDATAAASGEAARLAQELAAAQEQRFAAEARLPELEELQRQLAALNEELFDLQYTTAEQLKTSAACQQELQEQLTSARQQVQQLTAAHTASAEAATASLHELRHERDDAVELCSGLQGRVEELSAEVAHHKQDCEAVQQKHQAVVSAAAAEREVLEVQLVALQAQLEELPPKHAAKVASMEAALHKAQASADAAREEACRLEKHLNTLQAEKLSLECELEGLREAATVAAPAAVADLAATTKAEAAAAIAALAKGREQHAEELAQAEQARHSLEARLLAEIDEKAQLTKLCEEMTDMDLARSQERAAAAEVRQQLAEQLALLQTAQEAAVAGHLLEAQEARVQAVQLQLQDAQTLLQVTQAQAESMQQQLEAATQAHELERLRVQQLEQQLQEAGTALEASREQGAELQQSMQATQGLAEQLPGAWQQLQDVKAALQVAYQQDRELQKEAGVLRQQLSVTQAQAAELQEQLPLQASIQALRERDMHSQLSVELARTAELQQQLQAASLREEQLQQLLLAAQERADSGLQQQVQDAEAATGSGTLLLVQASQLEEALLQSGPSALEQRLVQPQLQPKEAQGLHGPSSFAERDLYSTQQQLRDAQDAFAGSTQLGAVEGSAHEARAQQLQGALASAHQELQAIRLQLQEATAAPGCCNALAEPSAQQLQVLLDATQQQLRVGQQQLEEAQAALQTASEQGDARTRDVEQLQRQLLPFQQRLEHRQQAEQVHSLKLDMPPSVLHPLETIAEESPAKDGAPTEPTAGKPARTTVEIGTGDQCVVAAEMEAAAAQQQVVMLQTQLQEAVLHSQEQAERLIRLEGAVEQLCSLRMDHEALAAEHAANHMQLVVLQQQLQQVASEHLPATQASVPQRDDTGDLLLDTQPGQHLSPPSVMTPARLQPHSQDQSKAVLALREELGEAQRSVEQLTKGANTKAAQHAELEGRLAEAQGAVEQLGSAFEKVERLEQQRDHLLRLLDNLSAAQVTEHGACFAQRTAAGDLAAELQHLQGVVADRDAQLLEKQVVLDEVLAALATARCQAAQPSPGSNTAGGGDEGPGGCDRMQSREDLESELAETLARCNRVSAQHAVEVRQMALHAAQLEGAIGQQRKHASALEHLLDELSCRACQACGCATPLTSAAGGSTGGSSAVTPPPVLRQPPPTVHTNGFTSPTPPPPTVPKQQPAEDHRVAPAPGAALLTQEVGMLRSELSRVHAALKNEAEAKRQAEEHLTSQLACAQERVDHVTARLLDLQAQLSASAAQATASAEEVQRLREVVAATEAGVERHRAEAACAALTSSKALHRSTKELEVLQAQHEALLAEHQALAADMAALHAEMSDEKARHIASAALVDELLGVKVELQQQLDTAQQAYQDAIAAQQQVEQQLHVAQECLRTTSISSYESADAAACQTAALALAQCNERRLASELVVSEAAAAAAQARAAQLAATQIALEEQLQEAHHRDATTSSQRQQLAAMSQQLQEVEASKARVEAQLLEVVGQMSEQARSQVTRLTQLQDELSDARARHAQLEGQLQDTERAFVELQHELKDAVAEAEMSTRDKVAELNAQKLTLESQIHWLTEQNMQLVAPIQAKAAHGSDDVGGAAAAAAAASEQLSKRLATLESELRSSRRAEQKLQALLYRLRKDVEASGGSSAAAALERLKDVRSLEYDIDVLTQKYKRHDRLVRQQEGEKAALQQQCSLLQAELSKVQAATLQPLQPAQQQQQQQYGMRVAGIGGSHADMKNPGQSGRCSLVTQEDKENAGRRV